MFKKVILGVAAASILAVPAAAAPFGHAGNQGRNDRGRVEQVVNHKQAPNFRQQPNAFHRQAQAQRFRVGQRFDRGYATNYRVIQNPRAYRLHDAPRGYRWVQSGHDAVLVAIAGGLIGSIFANAF